ncbi:hypothetical protein H8356DRAFT_547875 [Neocallimastix lanati (nom. inval.)]|jgi:uncharacterized protein YxjI|uniref:DUF567-domain-containing protein n=1 Tax=Neocallimastix californiae TaxID=1754190 RepID=A0A1Y2EP38_9FUNG|nr:hypothetical protein H8356DRAFT_547875 [Neocallimastix sp. JGI-2020a]ORY73351.1 hypothetical protein LY90DRAFT_699686 [Neocallimastix californiae]|eukprot:ORY73351.1 hypothetical protein LY90DRAFT_699686 [Neocallimastix californiae]
MLNFKNYLSTEIRSPPNPIAAIDSRFIFQQPVTLILKEKEALFKEDNFTIKDKNGVSFFQCNGKEFAIKDKKIIYDLYGKPIFNIKQDQQYKMRHNIYSEDTSNIIATVTPKSAFNLRKFPIEFTNLVTGQKDSINIKCDMFGYTGGMYYGKEKEGAPMICKILKNNVNTPTRSENYSIEIAPGVDIAFMVACTICFNEYRNESEKK